MRKNSSRDSRIYTDWLIYAESDLAAASMLKHNKKTLCNVPVDPNKSV